MSGFVDAFNEDIDHELIDLLGDDVIFIAAGASVGVAIKGVFVSVYYEAAGDAGGVGSASPAIECLDREVVNARGGQLIKSGVTYDIVGPPQPDGTGITLLMLRHAA